MGSFEYYQTSFSYTLQDTGEERFVGVPEQGGRDLISSDPLSPRNYLYSRRYVRWNGRSLPFGGFSFERDWEAQDGRRHFWSDEGIGAASFQLRHGEENRTGKSRAI